MAAVPAAVPSLGGFKFNSACPVPANPGKDCPGTAGCSPLAHAYLADSAGTDPPTLYRLHHVRASPLNPCSHYSQEELRLADMTANPSRIHPFSTLLSRAPAPGPTGPKAAPAAAASTTPPQAQHPPAAPAAANASSELSLDLAPGSQVSLQVQPGSSIVLRLAAPAGGHPLALTLTTAAAAVASSPAAQPPHPLFAAPPPPPATPQQPDPQPVGGLAQAQPGQQGTAPPAGGGVAATVEEPQPIWEAPDAAPALSVRDARWDRPMLPPEWRLSVMQGERVLQEVRLDERAADTLRISPRDGTLTLLGGGRKGAAAKATGTQAAGHAGVWHLRPRQLRRMVRMIERATAENAAGVRLWSRCGEGLLRKGLRDAGRTAAVPPTADTAPAAAAAPAPPKASEAKAAAAAAQPKDACPEAAGGEPAPADGQAGRDGPDSPAKLLLRELRAVAPLSCPTSPPSPPPAPAGGAPAEGQPARPPGGDPSTSLSQLRALQERAAAAMEGGDTSGSEDWARV